MTNKTKVIIAVIIIGAAFAAGYFSKPAEIKEVVKYKEAKNIVTIRTKYVYPDGTIKESETVKDKTVTEAESSKDVQNRNLGVRLALSKGFTTGATDTLQLGLQSPPLIKLFKMQAGLEATVNTEKEAYGGIYVQF